jgi:hypothetical protein
VSEEDKITIEEARKFIEEHDIKPLEIFSREE